MVISKKKRSSLKFSLLIFDFRPKIKVFSKKKKKKKRSSPKFGLLFLAVPHHHLSKFPDFAQIFHIAARKTMILPKYFLLTARKILILPKSSKLGGAIAIPAPPAGTAMTVIQVNRDIYTLRGYRAGILLRYYRTGMQRAVLPPLPPLAKGQGGQLPPLPPLFRHHWS